MPSPLRILLADDNQFGRFFAKAVLETQGLAVDEAENGFEVLDRLAQESYDAVLMDVDMPHLNGMETTRLIRTCERMDDLSQHQHRELLERVREKLRGIRIPIIAMTGYVMADEREECLETGMDDYMTKPFKPEEAISVIQRVVSGRRESGTEKNGEV